MESIVRATVIYLVLLLLFRLSGKRALSQVTTFDLVLLLIISEAIQQAMVGEDSSLTNAFLIVTTLVGLDILMSVLKQHSRVIEKVVEDMPLVLVRDGRLLQDRLDKVRVDVGDVLEAARELQGIKRLDQIEYAILERDGEISIIPKKDR